MGPFWNLTLTLLTQCRSLVGVILSPSNTWPRCPPHLPHMISTRLMPNMLSVCVTTEPLKHLSKAGHPHPLLVVVPLFRTPEIRGNAWNGMGWDGMGDAGRDGVEVRKARASRKTWYMVTSAEALKIDMNVYDVWTSETVCLD